MREDLDGSDSNCVEKDKERGENKGGKKKVFKVWRVERE
jgi:hypothetical protein